MEPNPLHRQHESPEESREKPKENKSAINTEAKQSESNIPLEDSYPLF